MELLWGFRLAMALIFACLRLFALPIVPTCFIYADGEAVDDLVGIDNAVSLGPGFALGVVAWIFGTVGAIVTKVLLRGATTDQNGPFWKCVCSAGGSITGAPARKGGDPGVGTV